MRYTLLIFLVLFTGLSGSNAGTYFQLYVPPNNENINRDVCLIVTSLNNDTEVVITDDYRDGDSDDSWSGTLNKGESYITYIDKALSGEKYPERPRVKNMVSAMKSQYRPLSVPLTVNRIGWIMIIVWIVFIASQVAAMVGWI